MPYLETAVGAGAAYRGAPGGVVRRVTLGLGSVGLGPKPGAYSALFAAFAKAITLIAVKIAGSA